MSQMLLEVDGLRVAYDKIEAVCGVDLAVGQGQIVTVIGPNGAGKTTLLSAIMGVLPSQGGIRFAGQPCVHAEVEEMVAAGLNLVPEKRELFAEMSVEDNLMLGAFHRYRLGLRDHGQTMDEVYELFPRLRERRAQLAGTLSGGERQMLAVGRALMAKPRLLMLDEPSLGLAPRIVREVFRIVSELRRRGVSILLIEQNARAALQVADYAYVLEMGRVTVQGPAAEIARDPRVIEVYLGLGQAATTGRGAGPADTADSPAAT
ncbi:ABC transporter ATP-binding protein [Bordetella pseudohinzii]|uniref:ABC transporter ATP-binding protein n=1 Tax=Bordetella pseudohinzii TaxID=1331258 RepID=A0A0J6C8K3_9BORD|nr:ABC transporter ATP-binding protein [Bordetella pseudohinzii]ANY17469.1 ABC transporter ATP-binding protein [Bordetella pseudohinzii]KMM25692.1 metal-dependent hydrolase [Bordetella pseudohinzii]KXA81685.1 ABC transporter ATP-binding protein [Bordetella pseudohinzii]KXA83076.1 ABC transporter ATP-binding protein [Bordetella pseudohinzii]CUI71808.1 LIV-I protein F [Bordetella pseudohinzii]